MIEVDGSYGEGGGQILRTSLALSCIFNQPFVMVNIRKNRQKAGLRPQHLIAVKAAQTIANAEVVGDTVGAKELSFIPHGVKGGHFRFDIGTAGSTSLVLQTIIPALLFSREKSSLTMTGGTHVPLSPSFHYLDGIFAPLLKKIGCDIRLVIDCCGFYPRGGGKVRAEIMPVRQTKPLDMEQRGKIKEITGCSAVGNLPDNFAERQGKRAEEMIGRLGYPVKISRDRVNAAGWGNFVFLRSEAEHSLAGFEALGAPGKVPDAVGIEAANEFLNYLKTGAALDRYMADQIVLYLALCPERSVFTTSAITKHLLTNLWVMGLFRKFSYRVEGEEGHTGRVIIN